MVPCHGMKELSIIMLSFLQFLLRRLPGEVQFIPFSLLPLQPVEALYHSEGTQL
jgi:hypothetical protein